MPVNAQHSSATDQWFSPTHIVDAARVALGGTIDLDPASCPLANATVKAKAFYTKADDGLSQPWMGKVFCNPPGGRIGRLSSQAVWWRKLVTEWQAGNVTQAVFVGFNIELLQTGQCAQLAPTDFCVCVPRKRVKFVHGLTGMPQRNPTHANVVIGVGRCARFNDRFSSAFGPIGAVFMGPVTQAQP